MPSETQVQSPANPAAECRDLLRPARDPFHSALAHTIEEVRALLDARPSSPENQVRDTGASLGAFASGRVDPERFAALLTHSLDLEGGEAEQIERAFQALNDLNERFDNLLELTVPPGASLRDCVAERLAEIGRAFGAAHLVNEIRAGRFDEAKHGGFLHAYPFSQWSSAERDLAPALFVEVDGVDLAASGLAEFMDGSVRIVLFVTGESPIAPLARLIAPRTYVMQAHAPDALATFAAWRGAGVAAVLPAGTVSFVHEPVTGLKVLERPDGKFAAVGRISGRQQEEDLALLDVWSHGPEVGAAVPAAAEDDVAGRLAGWLIQQAHLDGEG